MAGKPDCIFNIKSVTVGSDGRKVYLPVGRIALWKDPNGEMSGTLRLNISPDTEYKLYEDKP